MVLRERPNEGRTVIEKIETNAVRVGFAVVLLTPDDVGRLNVPAEKLRPRARQNVMFELGFFIGKLGRNRVCALVKGEIEIPSDYPVVFVKLDDGGVWERELARELKAADIAFDFNRVL